MTKKTPTAPETTSVIGTTLENVEVINHILFHKAILSEDEGGQRFNQYLQMVRAGEHLSMKDSFDRSIALAFDLVVQERLNPWDIDLVKFSRLYLDHARDRELDLVTAGRIILLAWTVLKLQSDDLVRRTQERKEEAETLDWSDIPDWGLSGPELDFTERVRMAPRAPIDEKVWHEGDRKVTLMELVDAFEVARAEADQRQIFHSERDAFKARLKAEGQERFKNRVHREDLEEDLKAVWERILGKNGAEIPLRSIYLKGDRWDFVTAFNSILFLRRDGWIELRQENFPYGPILLKNAKTDVVPVATVPRGEKR